MTFVQAESGNGILAREVLRMAKYISSSEAAKRLSVTTRTITRWIDDGCFPGAFKLNPEIKNSPFVIPHNEFEKFAEERANDPDSADDAQ